MAARVTSVEEPRCGNSTTCSISSNSLGTCGSLANTSRPAEKMVRFFNASISAASSTTEPRAMLMKMPFGPSALSTSALIMFAVARLFVAAVIDDRHGEGLQPARNRPTDAAHANYADGAVSQRGLGERVLLLEPLAGGQIALGLRKFAPGA